MFGVACPELTTAVTQKKGATTSRMETLLGCAPNVKDGHVCGNGPKQNDENENQNDEKILGDLHFAIYEFRCLISNDLPHDLHSPSEDFTQDHSRS